MTGAKTVLAEKSKSNKKRAVIFLNGDKPSDDILKKIDFDGSFVICADGAYAYAERFCRPDLLIGDFDSFKGTIPEDTERMEFPVKKDFTDSQLALRYAVCRGFGDISIYGAFGGRRDHEMVNYSLLALADSLNSTAVLKGDFFNVYFVTENKPFIGSVQIGKSVSLVPYSDRVHILYTKGLLFDAHDVEVNKTEIFTTSNTAVKRNVEYRLSEGTALLFCEN